MRTPPALLRTSAATALTAAAGGGLLPYAARGTFATALTAELACRNREPGR